MTELSEKEARDLVTGLMGTAAFTLRNAEYEDRLDYVFQRRKVKIGEVTPGVQYRSPEIEDEGNAFKNRMLAAPVKIEVSPRRANDARVQDRENFLRRNYTRWRDRQVFDGALFSQAVLGVGWTHLSMNRELLPDIPDQRKNESPDDYLKRLEEIVVDETGMDPEMWILESVNPATIYWTPDFSVILQAAQVPLDPLKKLYGEDVVRTSAPGTPEGQSSWTETTTLYIVETDTQVMHLLHGKTGPVNVKTYPNFLGQPGFFKVPGEITGEHDPLHAFRPLLQGKYRTVPIKNALATGLLMAGMEASQQRYALEWIGQGPPPVDEGVLEVRRTKEGFILPPEGYKVVSPALNISEDLPRSLAALQALDTYGFPKALRQPEEISSESGYDTARQQDAVASLLGPPLGHFANMLTNVFRAVLTGSLGAEEARGLNIKVNFRSVTAYTQIMQEEEGLKLIEAGYKIEEQFLNEIEGIDDLEEFYRKRAEGAVRRQAQDMAIIDVIALVKQLRGQISDQAMQEAGLIPEVMPGNQQPPQPQERGPSYPTGPGTGMPVQPQPPQGAMGGEQVGNPMAGVT